MGFSACVIIENELEELLFLRRGPTAPWKPGWWNLPGGEAKAGESPEIAAAREALEETGLTVADMRLAGVELVNKEPVYTFHTRSYSGTLRLSWENTEYRWVAKKDLSRFQIVPGIQQALMRVTVIAEKAHE